jgi:hypothetical protein
VRPRIVWLALATLTLVTAACGSGVAAPDPVPADALPGKAGEVIELDANFVAGDAIDFAELESILEDAGFAGGTQRVFSQSEVGRPQRSLARVLSFGDEAGAQAYLGWLEDHLDEVIGTAELLDTPEVPGAAFLAISQPECLCPKATPVYLAAWAKGSTVLTLEVGGKGVRSADVHELVTTLDGSVTS